MIVVLAMTGLKTCRSGMATFWDEAFRRRAEGRRRAA